MRKLKQKANLVWKNCLGIFLPISDRRLVTNLYCWSHGNRTIPRTAICQQRSLQISRIFSSTFGRCFNPQLARSHNWKVIFSPDISPRNNFIFEMMTELSKWLYIKPILRFVHFHGFYEPYPLFRRFIVIVFPMRSRSICTMTNCRRSLIVVWGLSLLLASPVLWTKVQFQLKFMNIKRPWMTNMLSKFLSSIFYN